MQQHQKQNRDTQIVGLIGRNILIYQLLQAGLEVALPERDRGIDLIAYSDNGSKFVARPIQVKAASEKSFSVHQKYKRVPNLVITYIWNLKELNKVVIYALTYQEALRIAKRMGWTKTPSWRNQEAYSSSRPGKKLCELLKPYKMNPELWREKIIT